MRGLQERLGQRLHPDDARRLAPSPGAGARGVGVVRVAVLAQAGRPGVLWYPAWRGWGGESWCFERIAALRPAAVSLAGAGGPERMGGVRVTASLFPSLGLM